MSDNISISMMTEDFLLWRCLHRGPLSPDTIDRWSIDDDMPWEHYRSRNLPLLTVLTRTYGACAVVAEYGGNVIGHLRFYPKVIWEMPGVADGLCLQQDHPAGPSTDFAVADFPHPDTLDDRTLKVHCIMIAPAHEAGKALQRRGTGTRMVMKLIDWAREHGWMRIEADAFEDLPLVYQITGNTGYTFWEKLGFRIIDRYPHPHLQEYSDFTAKLMVQATQVGIDRTRACDSIVMSLDLG